MANKNLRRFKGRFAKYKGDVREYLLDDPLGSYTLSTSYDGLPLYGGGTSAIYNNRYWQVEVNTDNLTSVYFNSSYFNYKYGTSSVKTSVDNNFGCLWNIQGGGITYSIDTGAISDNTSWRTTTFPFTQSYPVTYYHYLAWSATGSNATYLAIENQSTYVTASSQMKTDISVIWYENGSSIKTISITNSNIVRYKILYNNSTNLISVYGDSNYAVTYGFTFSQLIGTGSISPTYATGSCFYFMGIALDGTAATKNLIFDYFWQETVVTNDHRIASNRGNYGTLSHPPPTSTLMLPNTRY